MPACCGGDDLVCICLPAERLRAEVVLGEVAVDGGLEVDDAAEDAASEPALGQGSKEALDGVEPGRAGRREVEGYARGASEPGDDLRVFVGRVVVEDDVHGFGGRDGLLDSVEEADELLMPMALHTTADHLSVQHVERREQCRRAVALVVVRQGPGPAWLQG